MNQESRKMSGRSNHAGSTAGCSSGCLLMLLSTLLQSLLTRAANYSFNLTLNAQAVSAPPVRVGDVLTIMHPERYNVVQLANMYDWHACNFRTYRASACRKKSHVGWGPQRPRCDNGASKGKVSWPTVWRSTGGKVTVMPTVPGYIYLASNMTAADCKESGVRAIIYVAPKEIPKWKKRRSRIRKFSFIVANKAVSADCVLKTVPTVNGRYPGPTIRVTSGDTIIVRVTNRLNESISLHWHGLWQRGTQWQDGNAYGVQCPIPPGANYTYKFSTKGQSGTKWWHGHSGFLRASVYGALVIESPSADPIPGPLSKKRLTMMLGDWFYRQNQDIMTYLDQTGRVDVPDSLPINGATFRDCSTYQSTCQNCLPCSNSTCPKLTTLNLKKGRTYRIRLVNTGLYGNINFHIQGHVFTVVEADGELMKPVTYSSIDMLPGMSFSILLSTSQPGGGAFWIVTNGRFDNQGSNPGRAILRYGSNSPLVPFGDPPQAPAETKEVTWGPNQQASFKNLWPTISYLSQPPTKRTLIRWGIHRTAGGGLRYSVNNVSYVHPAIPLLYADYYSIPGVFDYKSYPDFGPPLAGSLENSGTRLGASAIDIPYNSMVDMIFQNHNPPGLQHSWHLHGYEFWVVGSGTGDYNRSLAGQYERKYNLEDAPLRNTVIVYARQWIAVRFLANNPGLWNLHCHLEQHMHLGMQTFIRVSGGPRIPPPPKNYIMECIRQPQYPPPPMAIPPVLPPAVQPPVIPPVAEPPAEPPLVEPPSVPPVATPPPVILSPPPVTLSPPPVILSPPPVILSPPPVILSPPPVILSPPPVILSPPPVILSPPPVILSPPPVSLSPPPVTVSPPPVILSPPPVILSPPPVVLPPALPPVVEPPPVVPPVEPPPVVEPPTPVTSQNIITWAQGIQDPQFVINSGDSVTFVWDVGLHAIMAYYRDPTSAEDIAAYERTNALLEAYVAKNGKQGVDFYVGNPADGVPHFDTFLGPPFQITLKITTPGTYLFICPVHLNSMVATVIVT